MRTPFRLHKNSRVEIVAAEWMTRKDAGLTASEATDYQQWLSTDPRNAKAMADLEITWSVLRKPQRSGAAQSFKQELKRRSSARQRRRIAPVFGVSAVVAALVLAFLFTSVGKQRITSLKTAPTVLSRPDRMVLLDGSTVELNAGAEITVDFQPTRRNVRLIRGEAHFEIAKDPTRPFVVAVGKTEVRAVGTQFLISYSPDAIKVLVTEGKVAVDQTGSSQDPQSSGHDDSIFLLAGTHLDITPSTSGHEPPAVLPSTAADVDLALAWRTMRVEFNGTPLGEALAIFNQRNTLQLSLAAPELSSRRLTGIFWTNDSEGFSRLLEQALSLRAVRSGNSIRLDAAP